MKRLVDIFNYRQVYDDLYDLINLEYNWNGYGAPAGTAYPYERAVPVIELLKNNKLPAPDIAATGNRTIQLEWEKAGHYLEIELYDDHMSMLCAVFGKSNTVFCDRNYSYNETDQAIEQVKRWDRKLPFLR